MKSKLDIGTCESREVLNNIPVHLDLSKVMTRLYFHMKFVLQADEVQRLIDQVKLSIKPRVIYKSSHVNTNTRYSLEIDGVEFNNALLKVNLSQSDRIFPYVVTIGDEVDLVNAFGSTFNQRYVLDVIREMALVNATHYVQNYITRSHNLDFLWNLEPGELHAWPSNGRKSLFLILGEVGNLTGVKLRDDYSLIPRFSSCGLFYHANIEFEACQVCSQEPCMGRRAPYSEELAMNYSDRARRPCGVRIRNAPIVKYVGM
jgi:hypothetical protein